MGCRGIPCVYKVLAIAELVVLGTGSRVERVNPEIRQFLRKKGISLEVQDTVSLTL